MLANGVSNAAFAISTILSLFGIPAFFLIPVPQFLKSLVDGKASLRLARIYIFLTAVHGVFLFFWRIYSGHFIEIPYLTVTRQT